MNDEINTARQSGFIVWNTTGHLSLQVFSGRNGLLISNESTAADTAKWMHVISDWNTHRGINHQRIYPVELLDTLKSIRNPVFIQIKNIHKKENLMIGSDDAHRIYQGKYLHPDFLVLSGKTGKTNDAGYIITDGTISYSANQRLKKKTEKSGIPFHAVKNSGAFITFCSGEL